jgi:anti-sigma factor RsiW
MASDSNAELMTAYLDDALEAGDAESFEKWLEDSPEARREVESLRKILTVVRELPEVEAPPDFYDKLAKKLRRRRAGPEGMPLNLVSLPFQVLSIIVIMVIAATYLMLEIERDEAVIEKDPSAAEAKEQAEREQAGAAAARER